MRSSLHSFDQAVTKWTITTFGQTSRPFFEFMTLLGEPITVCLIGAAIIGIGFKTSNMRLAMSGAAIPLTLIVGAVLKMIFERARPVTDYAMSMKIQTFSFPSGHSSGSMIAYGLLAYIAFVKLPTPWNLVGASLLALLPIFVGLSRVYLGAHFPSDVIAGWALGLVALLLVILLIKPLL